MSAFVDLNRRFRDLTDLQLADEDTVAASIGRGAGDGVGWQELLKVERVLLLAEAGSGKTREMEEQVKAINSRGEFAVSFQLNLSAVSRSQIAAVIIINRHFLSGKNKALLMVGSSWTQLMK